MVAAVFQTPFGRMAEQLARSHCFVMHYSGKMDFKICSELGAGVLLNKPIVIMAPAGVSIPGKLIAVADEIVTWNSHPETHAENVAAAILRVVNRLGVSS